ncbi:MULTISPECIES: hypothetical protein, partial [unclassified Endozoicomonas]|uniref:hypothetical protein n=1 Tax=unclassified Endozoicomonas TaxID=2644528 RepID=UPI0021481F1B
LLNEYLSGLLAKEKECQPKSRLPEFMGVDSATYRSWLTRTAQEILYWTALQPCEVSDRRASAPFAECFSEHIKLTGNLDNIMYPKPLHSLDVYKEFPRDFYNVNGQLNLGANNAVFPLVSLVKGLTLFASNVFSLAGQNVRDDDME